MKKITLLALILLLTSSALAQESIIKDFAEPRRLTLWMNPICLYPSTLRMINLTQDPQFNELVNDIEKVLIYTLDSTTVATKTHKSWLKEYEAIGYEEYISLMGTQEMKILGKENEYVGVVSTDGKAMAIYLRGEIPFAKIPKLLDTFRSNNVLPLITNQFK